MSQQTSASVRVSVCIPVYNVEACVERCARSLFGQTMKDGIEFIFADDCSPDGSIGAVRRVLEDYPERIGQVRFVRNEVNSGASVTRNHALEASVGEYVLFVDADDVLEEDWAAWAVAESEQTGADGIFGRVMCCKGVEDGHRTVERYETASVVFEDEMLWRVQEELLKSATDILPNLQSVDLGPCGKLFRRTAIGDVRFPVGIKCSEDQVFVHAVVQRSRKIELTNRSAYFYICNPKSSTHVMKRGVLEAMFRALGIIRKVQIDFNKTKNAFFERVIEDAWLGFCMENFTGHNWSLLFKAVRMFADMRRSEPLFDEACAQIHISRLLPVKHRLKTLMSIKCPWLRLFFKLVKHTLRPS